MHAVHFTIITIETKADDELRRLVSIILYFIECNFSSKKNCTENILILLNHYLIAGYLNLGWDFFVCFFSLSFF